MGGHATQVLGTLRNDMHQAPVVSGVHDFRNREDFIPAQDELDQLEWKATDIEWSYTVLAEVESDLTQRSVSALFKHTALHPRFGDDHIVVYGEEGAIAMTGCYGQGQFLMYDPQSGLATTDTARPHPYECPTNRR